MSNNPNPRPWQAQQAAQRLCVALGLSRDLHTDMLVRIISDSYSRIMDQLRSMQEERQLLRSILECETDDIENPLSPIEAAKKLVTERDTLCAKAPELVARAMEELKQLRANVGACDHTTESLSREEYDQALNQWLAFRHSTNSAYAAARLCCARRISRAGGTI